MFGASWFRGPWGRPKDNKSGIFPFEFSNEATYNGSTLQYIYMYSWFIK